MKRLSIIIAIPILLVLTSCNGVSFDSEKWKNWKENESNMHMRWDMADDLIENYHLEGKIHKEIIDLLGEPGNGVSSSEDNFYYDLGPCRSGFDYGSLYLEFKNGRVNHVEKHCN